MREESIRLFWEKVKKGEPDECWPWTRSLNSTGYGGVTIDKRKRNCHRVAYELSKGPIPPGLCVLHSCDNRACCNPNHLRTGTISDNCADMNQRGRRAPYRKVVHEDMVRAIRKEYVSTNASLSHLARKHGISITNVHSIVVLRAWKHVPAPAQYHDRLKQKINKKEAA